MKADARATGMVVTVGMGKAATMLHRQIRKLVLILILWSMLVTAQLLQVPV